MSCVVIGCRFVYVLVCIDNRYAFSQDLSEMCKYIGITYVFCIY